MAPRGRSNSPKRIPSSGSRRETPKSPASEDRNGTAGGKRDGSDRKSVSKSASRSPSHSSRSRSRSRSQSRSSSRDKSQTRKSRQSGSKSISSRSRSPSVDSRSKSRSRSRGSKSSTSSRSRGYSSRSRSRSRSLSRSRSRSSRSRSRTILSRSRSRSISRSRSRSKSLSRSRSRSRTRSGGSTASLNSIDSRKRSREKRLTAVEVDGLTRMVEERHLEEIFGVYGKIKELDLPRFKYSGENKGRAVIIYHSASSAKMAASHMDQGQIDGGILRVLPINPDIKSSRSNNKDDRKFLPNRYVDSRVGRRDFVSRPADYYNEDRARDRNGIGVASGGRGQDLYHSHLSRGDDTRDERSEKGRRDYERRSRSPVRLKRRGNSRSPSASQARSTSREVTGNGNGESQSNRGVDSPKGR